MKERKEKILENTCKNQIKNSIVHLLISIVNFENRVLKKFNVNI